MIKFLFLGIDACTYEKIYMYDCPFLQGLCKKYQHGVLFSVDKYGQNKFGHPHTGPSWNTIYTGVNAKEHGILAAIWAKGAFHDLEAKGPNIFGILGEQYRMGLMAMPASFPTGHHIKDVNGWAIQGFPAEGRVSRVAKWSYPEDLDVPREFHLESHHRFQKPESEEENEQEVRDKVSLAVKLAKQHKTEVLAVGIQHLDYADHSMNDVSRAYKFIDEQARKLFKQTEPVDFIVCSDHGAVIEGRSHSQEGFYACSLFGDKVAKTTFDIAPLTLWLVERRKRQEK
jgi:hypothetical protein